MVADNLLWEKNHNSCLENRKGDNKGIIKFLKLVDKSRVFINKSEMFMMYLHHFNLSKLRTGM
jgi:hypothetical protein